MKVEPHIAGDASPSLSVNADRIVWRWTDDNNWVCRLTNAFTVLSVRLFGDLDLDGDVDADDIALHPALSGDYGWGLPVSGNVFRKVRLRTDVGANMAGIFTLSLSGDPGIRIWTTGSPASTNSPLLVCGQTVTNGVGVLFLSGADSDLYVEAMSNGTATLTYAYIGTGDAEGLGCTASLKVTGWNIGIKLDVNEDGDAEDDVDGTDNYMPGYEGVASKITWDESGIFTGPQEMKLLLATQLPEIPFDSVFFNIVETSQIPGFCMNSASGGTEDDYSFAATTDNRGPIAGSVSGNVCSVPFYCKDFGGYCRVKLFCLIDSKIVFTQTITIPVDGNGNKIAEKWPDDAYSGTAPAWDGETTFYGSEGDGLTRMEEYRGFLVQNTHERLSVVNKELFIHRENNMYGTGDGVSGNVAVVKDIMADEMNGALFDSKSGTRDKTKTPRIVNFRYDESWHKVDQHALWVKVYDDYKADWGVINAYWGFCLSNFGQWTPAPNKPAEAGCVEIYAQNIREDCELASGTNFNWNASARAQEFIDDTIAHEIGHAIGIEHHTNILASVVVTNYPSVGLWDEVVSSDTVIFQGGDSSCVMRYRFSEIRAAICGDLDFDGIPCESGETPDTDWTPTVSAASGFCSSGDNCQTQIVIDDGD